MFAVRCRVCGTEYPPDTDTRLLCQHCGHIIGAGETIFDRVLGLVGELFKTNAHLDRLARLEQEKAQALPADTTLSTTLQVPGGGGTVIQAIGNLQGTPAPGRTWQVRRIVAGGTTVSTVAAGSMFFFRQGAPPNDLNLNNFIETATAMPFRAFYGTHQFVVRPGEYVWAALIGGTAGQQYVAAMQIEDWNESLFNLQELSA